MNLTTTSNNQPEPKSERKALPRPDDRYEWEPGFDRDLIAEHNLEQARKLREWGALRPLVGFFRCPWPITLRQYEVIRKRAVDKWITQMEREGWQLVSRVKIYTNKRRTASGTSGDWYSIALLGEVEIPVAAWFKLNSMKLERIEVPVTPGSEERE